MVTLAPDEAVRIRMLVSVTVAPSLGAVTRHGAEFAAEDMGPVRGRQVEAGGPVDTSCSPEGGRAGAFGIVADPQVAGVIGTNCSAAAVAASPVISDAGLVMISPSNTSPHLTSDLAGNANADYHPSRGGPASSLAQPHPRRASPPSPRRAIGYAPHARLKSPSPLLA